MIQPVRIQLSRAKGFNLQEYSRSINGLPAKKIDRSTKWGNHYKIGSYHIISGRPISLEYSLYLFKLLLMTKIRLKIIDIEELRGFNLACWCKESNKCHGDIYLKLLYPDVFNK